ncbi:MAG: hypothetical protein KAG64_09190 [Bacteroidales bacterium]|nr:hypothetical protein [Bacteroidales bacterium]
MEKVKRIASALIQINKKKSCVDQVNKVLSDYSSAILSRQGLSLPIRDYSLISLILETDANAINSLAGKIGVIAGVQIKVSMIKDFKDEI